MSVAYTAEPFFYDLPFEFVCDLCGATAAVRASSVKLPRGWQCRRLKDGTVEDVCYQCGFSLDKDVASS